MRTKSNTQYLYWVPEKRRWSETIPLQDGMIRLNRTIVYSWSQYNYNSLEQYDNGTWVSLSEEGRSPLECGHQWMIRPFQTEEGDVKIRVIMARVADETLKTMAGLEEKTVMQKNYELILRVDSPILEKARAFGVDIIDMSVHMDEIEATYHAAKDDYNILSSLHARALTLAHDESGDDALLEMEDIIERARISNGGYNHHRQKIIQAEKRIQLEPGRLPEKAKLGAWVADLQEEMIFRAIITLSKAITTKQAMTLKNASPQEQQAAFIADLLNGFYGAILAEANGEEIILYSNGAPAGIITRGALRPYREDR